MQLNADAVANQVIEAYKSKGLKAAPFLTSPLLQKGQLCCCGIGAMLYDPAVPEDDEGGTFEKVAERLGWETEQVIGFMLGFDQGVQGKHPRAPELPAGQKEAAWVGHAVAEAVINAGLRV